MPLPPISDEDSWKRLASTGLWWQTVSGEDLCKSFRQICADPTATNRVVETISRGLLRRLYLDVRPGVDRNLPNMGKDTVKATVDYLLDELRNPDSEDAIALCMIYKTVVARRRIDHVRKTLAQMRTTSDLEFGFGGQVIGASEATAPQDGERDDVDVEALLKAIPDEKKRKAFSLRHVDGWKVKDIAAEYGVEVRTIKRWDDEMRNKLLAAVMRTRGE